MAEEQSAGAGSSAALARQLERLAGVVQDATEGRRAKLAAELDRLSRFAGCERVEFLDGWERETLAPSSR